jgi:hypothetical protein
MCAMEKKKPQHVETLHIDKAGSSTGVNQGEKRDCRVERRAGMGNPQSHLPCLLVPTAPC